MSVVNKIVEYLSKKLKARGIVVYDAHIGEPMYTDKPYIETATATKKRIRTNKSDEHVEKKSL